MSHVLHLGDGIAGMAALPDRSVDHVITDPPYEAEAHTQGRRIKTVGGGGNYGQTGSCVLNFEPITQAQREMAAREMARVVRRWILVFCQVEAVAAWRDALEAGGAIYKRTCAWLKGDAQPQMSGDRPGMGYESIVCAHAPGRSRWNGGGKRGVYESARASTIENRPALHMTEKPLPLIEALVSDFTDPGELVLDAYSGSTTTGVACKRLGRGFIGWEIGWASLSDEERKLPSSQQAAILERRKLQNFAAAQQRLDAAREQFQLPRLAKPKQLPLCGPGKERDGA